MMKIWREIGVFEVTEQRLADQTKVIEQMVGYLMWNYMTSR